MSILSRMTTIFKAKMGKALDRAENPAEMLDYSYEKQVQMLRDVKRGVVEVTAAKRRLEAQASQSQQKVTAADDQARRALAADREDLARVILQRKQEAQAQLTGLQQQIAGLDAQEQKLAEAETRLETKIQSFRTQKEVIKAQYSAATAQVKIGEAFTGLSEEMTDVGMAIERAQNKTEQMQARAGAIDELLDVGVLTDLSGSPDRVEAELAQVTAKQNVEIELAGLKKELGQGEAPKQLESGASQ